MGPVNSQVRWHVHLRLWVGSCVAALAVIGGMASSLAGARTVLQPIAQFTRITFTDQSTPNDSKLQVAVVQAGPKAKAYVAHLRQVAPGITILAYQSFAVRPADAAGYTTCLSGKGSYPANWYLHGRGGQRAAWTPGSKATYLMDFGNSAYLKACAQHALAMARSFGADGVFLDLIATSVHWAQLPVSCSGGGASSTCANDRNWQNAMTSALSYMHSQMHAHGQALFGNIGGGNVTYCCGGGPAVWQRYVTQLDGAMEESWTYGTNGKPFPSSFVKTGLANTAWSEAHHKLTIVNDDITNCQACADYGLAAMLLVTNGYASYDVSNGRYSNYGTWWPSYNTYKSLGPALGRYSTQSNGLMVRRFVAGWIAVNDTTHSISDSVFGKVPAHSGTIRSLTGSLPGGGSPVPVPGGGNGTLPSPTGGIGVPLPPLPPLPGGGGLLGGSGPGGL